MFAAYSRAAALTVLLAVGAVACEKTRPPIPVISLGSTADTIAAPYSEITDAVWLADGRWAVVAPQDRAVAVADFGQKRLLPVGGAASKEYQQPFAIFRTGDSLVVADWARRRATIWSLTGMLAGAVPAVDALRGALPRARDAAGEWFFELAPPSRVDGSSNQDSAAVVRTSADFQHADTVMRLAPLDVAELQGNQGRRFERRALSGQDRWGVLPDGTVWVARVYQNRVDWRSPAGKVHRGDQLSDPVLPVTQNDRDLFIQRFPEELRSTAEVLPFAAVKPPFEGAFVDPAERVWLAKSRSIGDSIRRYQVVDTSGYQAAEYTSRGHGRVLAAGGGAALLAEPYAGGVRLMQLRIP